ncbi:MAG: STAS domain-containing protein [Leptospiraceae bacterium]|nr:STAS domain-containing protein [Leptospiraceae bacterium]MCB1304278.1 STAS domain-containing protein [Leptospiraceae bacterium]
MELEFPELKVGVEEKELGGNSIRVVKLTGRITNSNSQDFNRKFYKLLESTGQSMIFDLTDLDYINSTGVAILFSIHYRARENGGRLIIGGIHSFLRKVFGLMDLPPELKLYPTLEEALEAVASGE